MNELRFKKASAFADLAGGCKVDMDARTIVFYASAFGMRDSVGDVVDHGAFAKTIAERQPKRLIKLGRNHFDMIGLPSRLLEDDYGLLVHGKVDRKPVGDETLEEAESGTLSHASFMYRVIQSRPDSQDETTTHLTELKLYEVGPVYFPANEAAMILAVQKALGQEVSPDDFSLADLLAPVRRAVNLLADRDRIEGYERRELSAALKDLGPFVERLRALEAAGGGPDPLVDTTRQKGPEPLSATTPGDDEVALDTLEKALAGMKRLRDRRAA